ncbi:uncharacterized protein LOC123197479 [Mangifera indica]|uniref:uncharacterized protein LOC123197479 n=1 Tax=Mangifera indica TaxID=29780 RepID=UPI001CFB0226|nr:uncharacterized protein LOC123197479 [Mangifera indica]
MVNAKLDALTKKFERLDMKVVRTSSCENCGGDHANFEYQMGTHYAHEPTNEQVNFLNYNQRRQGNPYSNTYNPGWRNHPNFAWSNQANTSNPNQNFRQPPPRFQARNTNPQPLHHPQPPQEQKSNLELMIANFILAQKQKANAQDEAIRQLTAKVDQLATHNKMLEVQLGQQASTSNSREMEKLPSQPQNPREHCKDVEKSSEEDTLEKKVEGNIQEAPEKQVPSKTYSTPLPFPQRFQKAKLDQQFGKFLDVFKQIHLNVPLMEAITQMKLEEFEMVALSEECSAILQNKLPPKLKDPGSFSIPCVVGKESFEKALCDLGASISLLSLSICRRLELGELKPTTVTLQLADRSIKYPSAIMENVLIKVGKFYIPIDFMVLEIEEDIQVPLILGRPFLATAGAIIDVKNGKLTFEITEEKVEFNVFRMSKQPNIVNSCCRVDIIDDCVKEVFIKKYPEDPLESCIIHGTLIKDENMEIAAYAQLMEANPKATPILNFKYEELETGNRSLLSLKAEDATKIDLKPLPANLRYAFLRPNSTYPVIINVELNDDQEDKLLRELRAYRKIIGYNIYDIKGISPTICMHRIHMLDDFKPTIEHQRKLNLIMKEVVRNEVIKLLDAGIIYPISNSS